MIIGISHFNGCSDSNENSPSSAQEKPLIPQDPPVRQISKNTPELFIYTNTKIKSSYTQAYFYFFEASEHFSYFSPTENFENFGYIKKRGNSTAQSPKRPYNIKFDEKIDFFGMGKAKKMGSPFQSI